MNQSAVLKSQSALEETMRKQMKDMHYADALNALAELVRYENVKPEFLYDGAYSYFMLGDYTRAASWVDNTLTLDPSNRKARILLARICILEDRVDDGLAVFDFVLERDLQNLSEEESKEIRDIISYYVRREEDKIRRHYPHIAAFAGLTADAPPAEAPPRAFDRQSESHSILQSLKERAKQSGKNPEPAPQEPPQEAQPAAADLLTAARKERDLVLQQNISLREKVRLLNVFAGGYYYQRALEAAKELLIAAIQIDPADQRSLKNMSLLLLELGQPEKALQIASRMRYADFALLRALRTN